MSEELSNTCQLVKTFECSFCGKCFEKRNYLNLHKGRVHGKLHENDEMENEREKNEELENGVEKNNCVSLYNCDLCAKCFQAKEDLNSHVKNKHRADAMKLLSERIEQLEKEIGKQKLDTTENLLVLKEKETIRFTTG